VEAVVGDIATVFFRSTALRQYSAQRAASGPELSLFNARSMRFALSLDWPRRSEFVPALRGGLMSELIVDEPTARALLWPDTDDASTNEKHRLRKIKNNGLSEHERAAQSASFHPSCKT